MVKVIVFGLDGGTWNIIKPLIEKQKLPTIAKLVEEGCWGDLESSIPPITYPAWKCYSTGKNPGKLGVYWFLSVDTAKQEVKVNNSRSFRSKELWDYLSENGLSCGVLNMPTTYPPKRINGFIVSRDAPSYLNYTYPKKLGQMLRKKYNYKFTTGYSHRLDKDRYLAEVRKIIRQKFQVARFLLSKFDPDFFHMTVFYTDSIQHFFWEYMEDKHPIYGRAIEKIWRLVDQEIGNILRRCQDSHVILMSDHGFTSVRSTFQMARWLIEKGYLTLLKPKFSSRGFLAKMGLSIEGMSELVRRSKLLPLLASILPIETQRKLYAFFPQEENVIERNPLEGLIDWRNSRVIPLSQGLLYINPKIFHSERAYASFREKLLDELKELRNPKSGENLVDQAYKAEEIYSGPFVGQAPSIVILPTKGYQIASSVQSGEKWVHSRKGWSGTHKLHGIFAIRGPNIRRGCRISDANILDLMPTILHIFGVPIPRDVDGEVLKQIFEQKSDLGKRKIRYQEASTKVEHEKIEYPYSKEEEKEIKDRLRELGYF